MFIRFQQTSWLKVISLVVKTKTLQIKFGTCFSSYLSFSSNSLPPNSVLMLWITLSGSKKSRHPYWRGIRWCKVGCQISSRVFMQGCGQAWGVVVQAVWQIHAQRQPGMRYQKQVWRRCPGDRQSHMGNQSQNRGGQCFRDQDGSERHLHDELIDVGTQSHG